jgi:hypothetical protein
MQKEQIVSWLTQVCGGKDWFHSVGLDRYNRPVVYVHYMNADIIRFVPDWAEDGSQVLCHFASSITKTAADFLDKPQQHKLPIPKLSLVSAQPQGKEFSITLIIGDELDRLEILCGSDTLQDIFYEIKDGENAITNLSVKFPQVRRKLENLYDKYGFDPIYEQLNS